jgi:altronate dehydratase
MSDPRLLSLHPDDNVLTVISPLSAGDEIRVAGAQVRVEKALPMGHKLAARDIAAGEKIIKYGVPIGSASRDIRAGEHVHTHNVQSDYIPTYLREDQARLFAQTH